MQSADTTPDLEKDPSTPRNKGGRPKGSKTRPKWLREQMKRPRGRPKGSKNKPKSMEIQLPPKPPPKPKDASKSRPNSPANFAKLSPEERSALGRRAALSRKPKQCRSRAPGTPPMWSTRDYAPLKEEAKREARRIFKIMDKQGLLPDDEIAREAVLEVLTLMREPGDKKFKHSLARTLLEYTKPKPSQKSEVTIKTAEDFLDELEDLPPEG
jgi:hypothetical protein